MQKHRWITLITVLALLLGALPIGAARPDATPQAVAPVQPVAASPTATNWCVAGELNGWNNSSTKLYDDATHGDLIAGDGLFAADITVANVGPLGMEGGGVRQLGNAFPGQNAWLNTTAANQSIKITFDTANHATDAGAAMLPATNIVNVWDSVPAAFTAVGDFQGWNNGDPATALAPVGNAIHRLAYQVANPGSYIGKVTATGTWDAYGADGRSKDAGNIQFTTTTANQVVIFLLDTATGRLTITPNGGRAGNWCLVGELNGWNNASLPMFDDGTHGDLLGGDGVFTLDHAVPNAGRSEWKAVECGNWGKAFPGDNAWLNTAAANQTVKFTFDTNDHTGDAGLPLWPKTNIVNAWDVLPAAFTAVGDFQGWNNANAATAMTAMGNGWHLLTTPIAAVGNHIGKVTTTGSWDAFGKDGRSKNAGNMDFITTVANQATQVVLDGRSGPAKSCPCPRPSRRPHPRLWCWNMRSSTTTGRPAITMAGACTCGATPLTRRRVSRGTRRRRSAAWMTMAHTWRFA